MNAGRNLFWLAVMAVAGVASGAGETLLGQDTVTNPGQQLPQTQNPQTVPNTPQQDANFTPDSGPFSFDNLERLNIQPETVEFENERLQPFVGRSLERYLEQGLVHPRSLIDPASAGGQGGGGGGGGFNFGGFQNQGLQQQGTGLSFEVARRSLRTRIRPEFTVSRQVTGEEVSRQFRQRLSRLPVTFDIPGVQVQVQGRTAVLTGVVGNSLDRQRIERMARLEPGIYRIDNRIQVRPTP